MASKERFPSSGESRMIISVEGIPELELDDLDDPRKWDTKKRAAISFFALLASFVANVGTPIYIAAVPYIQRELKISQTLAILPFSLYSWAVGFGALFGTAACEIYGRPIIYQFTIPISLIFTIVGAAATNFTVIAIARAFAGLASGPCLTVGAGVLNDVWDVSLEKTGTMFAFFYVLTIIWATQTAPMISAALMKYHSWHWTFWVSVIMIAAVLVCSIFLPETYHPQIRRARAQKLGLQVPSRGDLLKVFVTAVGRPLHMILVEPVVFPTGLACAITQSVVFVYYVAYAMLFEETYGFTQYQVGMAFGPLLIGATVLAIPVLALFDKLTYQKAREQAIQNGQAVKPEKRLYPAMLSSITLPISLFWLAWSGKKSVHWIVPVLSGVPFGMSYVLNMLSFGMYNNDIYTTRYGASTIATSTFMRFLISSPFPLFTAQMVSRLSFAWATSLLGFITVAMIPVPWVFYKWGPALRKRTMYMKE